MTHAALTMRRFAHKPAMPAALPGRTQAIARNEESLTNTASASRVDFGALEQILVTTNDIAVSPDDRIMPAHLSANPIDLSRWIALFGAVNERIAETVALMSNEAYWRDDVPEATSARTVMHECADALSQLHIMFPVFQPQLTPAQQELVETRAALAVARADLLKSQMHERVARDVALHDGLTSLPNRTFLMWHLKRALAESLNQDRPVALLYLDLDGLKPVNDQHGHDVGDAMLQITAQRLRTAVPADTFVSRLGGDEFVCLLKGNNTRRELAKLAESLIDAVSAELLIGENRVAVRPSIGIAISEADSSTPETLLKHADAAMYRAKRSRAGYVFCDHH